MKCSLQLSGPVNKILVLALNELGYETIGFRVHERLPET